MRGRVEAYCKETFELSLAKNLSVKRSHGKRNSKVSNRNREEKEVANQKSENLLRMKIRFKKIGFRPI